ncbi:MAG: hypothetical protein KGD68_10500, partial [Candidatus Lokiarchaeota archaeon]|nr:hypothetical protein [Candidatus Lokiarchaeota archaeon]
VLGDYSAGKPPFIIRYISGFFLEELKETISVDFYSKITDFKARRVNIKNHH